MQSDLEAIITLPLEERRYDEVEIVTSGDMKSLKIK